MKNKKLFFIIFIIILIVIISIIIFKNMTKNKKNGNNMSSQEIVDKILSTSFYKSKIYVEVISNKNRNKYILTQEYNSENECIQEVIEPENIAGIKIIKKDNKLILQNSQLNLNTIFENYKGLDDNNLDLNNFLKEYKENNNSFFEENDEEIIMQIKSKKENPYIKNKFLYIKKENAIPTKLIIKDDNQNTKIIIEYNEIELK